jgi:hypothetical protein
MTRANLGRLALLCLAVGSGACASRKEGADMAESQTTQAATPGASLRCELSVPASLKVGAPVKVTFRLTNPTAQPLFVLNWNTPLDDVPSNCLEVTRAGAEIPYQGPMFKRADPEADDYVAIAPGASVENQMEASLPYDFQQPGTYRIAFRGTLLDVTGSQAEVPRPRAQHRAVPVQCPPVETTISP